MPCVDGDGLASLNVGMPLAPRKKCVRVAEGHFVNSWDMKHPDASKREALKIRFSQLFRLPYLEGFSQSIRGWRSSPLCGAEM